MAERDSIRESCTRRGIEYIFHYTVVDHLPSILEHRGILCREMRRRYGIDVEEHGWGPTGRCEDLCEYVSCSLEPPYGMIEREMGRGQLILCEIDSCLIWEEGTLFCPAWSSHRDFDLDYLKQYATAHDFDSMFPNPYSSEPRFLGAEILIKDVVPLSKIRRVNFPDFESRSAAIPECDSVVKRKGKVGANILFTVRPEVFKRPPEHYLKRKKYHSGD